MSDITEVLIIKPVHDVFDIKMPNFLSLPKVLSFPYSELMNLVFKNKKLPSISPSPFETEKYFGLRLTNSSTICIYTATMPFGTF
jgi:hypothetical protein